VIQPGDQSNSVEDLVRGILREGLAQSAGRLLQSVTDPQKRSKSGAWTSPKVPSLLVFFAQIRGPLNATVQAVYHFRSPVS